jgi:hypothetical protein
VKVLTPDEWQRFEAEHIIRVDAATAGHRTRRVTAVSHPVEDFLFTYYANSVTALRRWHPGAGVGLVHADREAWRFYRTDGGVAAVNLDAYLTERGVRVATIRRLLAATLDRPASFGCFGLHEWAMLHHVDQAGVRHHEWPLRLGQAGTDAVVESHQVTCSHVDAFRFFTPTARPLNTLQPTRERQTELEQPGCLHAGMDCYKWAYQLVPAVPSELVMDCFDLARDIRVLDMRASPYDLRALGYEPVPIETREGKAAYVEAQRAFTQRSQELRRRLLAATAALVTRSAA